MSTTTTTYTQYENAPKLTELLDAFNELNGVEVESKDALIEMIGDNKVVSLFICDDMGSKCDE